MLKRCSQFIVLVFLVLPSLATASDEKPASDKTVVRYTVVPGDNIGNIALRFGVGVGEVKQWSQLESYDVEPGTELIVRSAEKVKEVRKDPLPVIHVVRKGDTFEKIAKKYKVSIKKVKRWNSRVYPRKIQIGQRIKLYIPGRDGRSVSSGKANRGRLYNGVAMRSVPGLRVRNVSRAYGTRRMIHLLEASAYDIKAQWPDAPDLEIGDISYKGGGRMRPHKSHQSGRDADVSYYHRGNLPTGFRDLNLETFDAAKNWHLFKTLIDSGQVEYIFVEHKLQKALYEYATYIGFSPEELRPILQYPNPRSVNSGVIRHAKGHDDHFHIRFTCGPKDKNCR